MKLLNSEQAANGQGSPSNKNPTERHKFSLMHLSAFSSKGCSHKVTSDLKEQLMEAAVSESSSHMSQPLSYSWEAVHRTITPHPKNSSAILEYCWEWAAPQMPLQGLSSEWMRAGVEEFGGKILSCFCTRISSCFTPSLGWALSGTHGKVHLLVVQEGRMKT